MSDLYNYIFKKRPNDTCDMLCGIGLANVLLNNKIRMVRESVAYEIKTTMHNGKFDFLTNSNIETNIIYKNKRITIDTVYLNGKRYNFYNIVYRDFNLYGVLRIYKLYMGVDGVYFTLSGDYCPYSLRDAIILAKAINNIDYIDNSIPDEKTKQILLWKLMQDMFG